MSGHPNEVDGFLSPLLGIAEYEPRRPLFTFVDNKGRDEASLSAAELVDAAGRIAGMLRKIGLGEGVRAVLVYPPSLDFVAAFVGCLAAGVIPVPVCPPNLRASGRGIDDVHRIIADCAAGAVLTNRTYHRLYRIDSVTRPFRRRAAASIVAPWYCADLATGDEAVPPSGWYRPDDLDQTAFIQYTSGSTTAPRGVLITHRNLIGEAAANQADLGLGPDIRAVSWAPHFHDLGLISVILNSLAGNGHSYLMSPLTFLRDPGLWLDVVSRVRATHTCAPNFAYEMVIRRTTPERRRSWDFGSLRVAMCAAEAIRPETVQRFKDTFAPQGFRPEAFFGAYGLAEHTVSVTMGGNRTIDVDSGALADGRIARRTVANQTTVQYFSSGRLTKHDATLLIVDPATGLPCPPDRVGEVWVDSVTKARGYHGRQRESEDMFHATVPGDSRTYLRTGDLGFLHEDELFITGRIKEMIVLRGRNLYAVDIEFSVRECHPLIRPGGLAAFAVTAPDGTEGVGLFVVLRDRHVPVAKQDEVITAIQHALAAQHQVNAQVIVLGRAGLVPKTTSGKIKRGACQQALRQGTISLSPHLVRIVRPDLPAQVGPLANASAERLR